MEHPCYKCQAVVEEGVPFCPHCAAPQIRVIPPQPVEQTAAPEQSPVAIPQTASPWGAPRSGYIARAPIHWDQAWEGALLAGAGAGVLSSLPVVALGTFLWITIAGAVAVSLYLRRVPATLVRPGMGMRIGALAGVFASGIVSIVNVFHYSAERDQARELLQSQMQAQIAKAPDPASQEMLRQLTAKLMTPQGMAIFFAFALLFAAAVFVLFSAIGGALGASMAARRRGLN